MTFCLESTIIRPENDAEVKNVIILLHGYGGDGKGYQYAVYELEKTST